MNNYTIPSQEIYNQCIQRLEYLKNANPQTEGMKLEIVMIETEVEKFDRTHKGVDANK